MTSGRIICAALGCPDAELSIVITDDEGIRALNLAWRGKDKPTDVLSFSQIEESASIAASTSPGRAQRHPSRRRRAAVDPRDLGARPLLGDVVISAETAAHQAPTYGHRFEDEIDRLLVHGVLHLLGHDHVHGGHQARIMKAVEQRLVRKLRRRVPLRFP